jgi:hypothetical protein
MCKNMRANVSHDTGNFAAFPARGKRRFNQRNMRRMCSLAFMSHAIPWSPW